MYNSFEKRMRAYCDRAGWAKEALRALHGITAEETLEDILLKEEQDLLASLAPKLNVSFQEEIPSLNQFLEKYGRDLRKKDLDLLVEEVAKLDRPKAVWKLLELGADPEKAYLGSAFIDNWGLMQQLEEKGLVDRKKIAKQAACQGVKNDLIRLYFKFLKDFDGPAGCEERVISLCGFYGLPEEIAKMAELGYDLNMDDGQGFIWSIFSGNLEAVRAFLENGIDFERFKERAYRAARDWEYDHIEQLLKDWEKKTSRKKLSVK